MKKFWKEILFFSVITAYFCYGLSPDMTWLSIGADQINYVVAALYNAPAGLSGNPLYILLGSLFVRLPGSAFWNLGLLSALPAAGTCIVIFLTVKKFTTGKFAPYIAALVFASSFSVWAESVIAETYMITALASSLVIYFCFTRHYYWMASMMAVGVGLHPLGMWVAIPCLVFTWWQEGRNFKLVGKILGIAVFGLVFRLRDVFTTEVTTNLFFMQNPYENLLYSAGGYFGNAIIPIQPTLQSLWEDFAVLGSSLWAVVFAVFTFNKKPGVMLLWIIFGLTCFFPFASIYPQWIKYFFLPILPLSILVGIGVDRLNLEDIKVLKYFKFGKYIPQLLLIPCIVFMVLNVATYSPVKTIDVGTTTARQFYYSLDNIPDNSIVVGHTWGHPDLVILLYSVEHQDRFDYINLDSIKNEMSSEKYLDYQRQKGLVLPGYSVESKWTVEDYSKSIQIMNPEREVYVTYVKSSEIPMQFGLIPVSEYSAGLNDLPSSKIQFSR